MEGFPAPLTMLRNAFGDADGKGNLGSKSFFNTGGGQWRSMQRALVRSILDSAPVQDILTAQK
jgi:hypothetical protein